MSLIQYYYIIKPLLPRSLQLALRRLVVARKRARYENVWPIDEKAYVPPAGWAGWPGGKKFALVLTHDVDTAKGHANCRKLMKLEQELGVRSSFNFVPRRYAVSKELRENLVAEGFEVGVHGLYHDGKYYNSREIFRQRAAEINKYIEDWGAVGFRSPAMHNNLEWIHDLNLEYDASTFDTDPFEPQPEGVRTVFPFWVHKDLTRPGYVELPYTLPQDFTLFVMMRENNIDIWKRKLDWIASRGGMALMLTHPDYQRFDNGRLGPEEYHAGHYARFLEYVRDRYKDECWHVLPKDMAKFWAENYGGQASGVDLAGKKEMALIG